MKHISKFVSIFMVLLILAEILYVPAYADEKDKKDENDGMNMYRNSDFIEKEQPELNEETKKLISLYQKNPTEENYKNLREMVIKNYDAVLERKEAKLAELKEETAGKPGGEEKVAEMEEIVQEMYITYWSRINSSMLRFSDSRLLDWKIADAPKYSFIPVMGAGDSIYISRTEVTNAEYKLYIMETGATPPSNWDNGSYPSGEDMLPVNFVSYNDAVSYCEWLTKNDGVNTYRLPTESEWELAAGHMPKDADFNCGVCSGRTPVNKYGKNTRGAHGAIDFWGNVWEWTSTKRQDAGDCTYGVKGGSYSSERTDCRTEYREEGRNKDSGYEDVGFRVIKVMNGLEPEKPVDLTTINSTQLKATSSTDDSISLFWDPVDNAVNYQIFEYHGDTGLFEMIGLTENTTFTIENLIKNKNYGYIVQPISYTAAADVVYPEKVLYVTCGQKEYTVSDSEHNQCKSAMIEEITYNSSYLGADRKANVYFPCGYDENIKYDVIYLLHGMSGNYKSYGEIGVLEQAKNIIEKNGYRPVMLVSMTVFTDRDGKGEEEYSFAQLAQKYDNCIYDIVESLIPFIESHYNVNTGREHTGICGYSLGGREALYLAYSYPDIFGYVGAFSPVSGVVEAGSNNFTADKRALLDSFELEDGMKQPEVIVLVVGTDDAHCLKSTKEYDELMNGLGIDHIFYTVDGGHEVSVWNDGFETFLKMILSKEEG